MGVGNVSKNRKIGGWEKLGIPSYLYPWLQVVQLSNMSTFFGAIPAALRLYPRKGSPKNLEIGLVSNYVSGKY